MKLMTKEIEKKLPALYSQDGKPAEDVKIIVKFFAPWNNWKWFVTEGEYDNDKKTWVFFGLVKGFETELGYFTLAELESIQGPYGMKIERDRNFSRTLAEVKAGKIFVKIAIYNRS